MARSSAFRTPRSRAAAVLVAASLVGGCAPKIGDKCLVASDCSNNGSRVCDTSQPDGYCTVFSCTGDSCPNSAACVLFGASVPGCPYDDYQAPSRSGRTECMATCNGSSDCRQDQGYICASPLDAPWLAVILDNDQSEKVCIAQPPTGTVTAPPDGGAAVCMPQPSMSFADAAPADAEPEESADAPSDVDSATVASGSTRDAGLDAGGGAGFDAGADGAGLEPEAGAIPDAGADAVTDALSSDGPAGD